MRVFILKDAPMNRIRLVLALTTVTILAACAVPMRMPIVFSGETRVDETLRSDVTYRIVGPLRMATRCSSGAEIETKVVKENPPVPGDPNDFVRLGRTFEHWFVTMCGQRQGFQILFAPSPKGGTDFSIRKLTPDEESQSSRPPT